MREMVLRFAAPAGVKVNELTRLWKGEGDDWSPDQETKTYGME